MSKNAIANLLIFSNLVTGMAFAAMPFWFLPLLQSPEMDFSKMPVALSYGFFGVITVITIRVTIQLIFVRAVKTDDSPIELLMPWAMGNLWDDPKNYFSENIAGLYRPWRIIANIFTPIALIGIVIATIVVSMP